jgi:acyl carrier protein
MAKEDRFERLKAIIIPYLPEDISQEAISPDSNLTGELNINSANLVDIILDVEDAFDITLENEDMDGMQTVADALEIIASKVD